MKQIKSYLILGFFFVSVLGTAQHFFYDWSGENFIVGLFSPVNESTWEHMKLLFFPSLLYLFFLQKKLGNSYPHIAQAFACGIITGIIFLPTFFYTYTGILGYHITFLDIATFYLSVAVTFFTAYILTKLPRFLEKRHCLTILVILTVSFFLFTYIPPELGIFANPL